MAVVVLLLTVLCGCTGATYGTPACADVTSAVLSQIELPSASEKNKESIGAYYGVDTTKIADLSVFMCGSGAYPDEIAVFRFTDNPGSKLGMEAVDARLLELKETFADYTPEEMYKLENPVIKQYGDYVVFCALSDNEKAAEIIENAFKS
jgi:hypothetical protein